VSTASAFSKLNTLTVQAAALLPAPQHTVVLLREGIVRAWGYNGNGQLGDGTTADRHSPTVVAGLGCRRSG